MSSDAGGAGVGGGGGVEGGGAGGKRALGELGGFEELKELIAEMKKIPIHPPDPIEGVHSETPVPIFRRLNNSFAAVNDSEGPAPEDLLLRIIEEGREQARDEPPKFEYLQKTIKNIIETLREDDRTHTHLVVGVASVLAIEINCLLFAYNPPNKAVLYDSLRELYGLISGYVRPEAEFKKLYRKAKDIVYSSVGPALRDFLDRGDAAAAVGGAGAGGGRRKRKYSRKHRKGRKGGSRNKRRTTQ